MQLHPLLSPQPLLLNPNPLPDPLHRSRRMIIQQQLSPPNPQPERLLEQELLHPQFVADKSLIVLEPPK